MSTIDQLAEVLKTPQALVRFLPIRIVLRKKEDGKLQGLVENSFSMDMSDTHASIFWSGKAYSMLGEHNLDGIKNAEHNANPGDLILDPLAEDCPVTIDWDKWLTATAKYYQRNAPFKMKETQ
jgi:hypothetical protein